MKKPRPANTIGRKRRAAGWTLLALGLLVAAVWVASGWWSFQRLWLSPGGDITVLAVESGRVGWVSGVTNNAGFPQHDRVIYAREQIIGGLPNWQYYVDFVHSQGSLPLWPFLSALWLTAALLLRSGIIARRRAMNGICMKCGYSLAGLPSGSPCPECGKGAVTT